MSKVDLSDDVPDRVIALKNPARLEPVPEERTDKYPVLGAALIPDLYSSVACIGKVKSGKTTMVYNILKACSGYTDPKVRTKVIAFSGNLHNDPKYDAIKKMLQAKRVPFIGYTSIYQQDEQGHHDLLEEFMELVRKQGEEDREKLAAWESGSMGKFMVGQPIGGGWQDPPGPDEKRPFLPTIDPFLTKQGQQYPEYIIVLDDLAKEINKPIVGLFIRSYRHLRVKIVMASQHFVDPSSATRVNLKQWFLWRGLNVHKLKTIYESASPTCSLDRFIKRYKHATSVDHRPLVINVDRGTMTAGTEILYERTDGKHE
jgi:hypothetical protein